MVSFLLLCLVFLSGIISEAFAAAMWETCDSERPDPPWATHRTLTIPESCLSGSAMEVAMADALCCVYTHVVVDYGSGSTNTVMFETYDGSKYRISDDCGAGGMSSIAVMEEVMDRVCAMSMGSQDCLNQAVCIENAKTTTVPSLAPTEQPKQQKKSKKSKKVNKKKKNSTRRRIVKKY